MFDFKRLFSGSSKKATGSKEVVGIDFGSSSVKVVQLNQREDYVALKTYGELLLGPYVDKSLGEAVVLPLEKRIEALVDVVRESSVAVSGGVLALPLSSSFMTVVNLTLDEGEEIGPRIRVEARKFIPVPLKDVSLEWSELPPLTATDDTQKDVLIAAVQNEVYADMNKLLSAISLTSQPTEIEVFCTQRALSSDEVTTEAYIDLGALNSKLYIAHEKMIRKLHRVFAGGAQATKQIAATTGLSYDDAEQMKRTVTPDHQHAAVVKEVMEDTFSRPLQEFKRVLSHFESTTGQSVERVVLSGGSASYPQMVEYARYILDRDVTLATPFDGVARPAFLEDTLDQIGPTFSVALGAALRSFT